MKTNLFYQSIGIYYKDRQWAEEAFEMLVKEFPPECIERKTKAPRELMCCLKTGVVIRCVPATDSSRGCRFDKVLIQPGISYEVYSTLIRPHILSGRRPSAFIMCFIDDSDFQLEEANTHYYKLNEEEHTDVIMKVLELDKPNRNLTIFNKDSGAI